MNLNQINSFLAVSRTLNFTNAAKQNSVPQSTISRQINDLEEQLGVKLFHRTRRDVALTEEGRAFLPYAQEISDAARKGAFAVKQLHEGATGRLSLATTVVCEAFLSECLAEFGRKYPDILVDIKYISGGASPLDDECSACDFFFIYREMLPVTDELEKVYTHREALGIARAKSSANAAESPALRDSKFILLSEEADPIVYMQTMNYCRTHRFKPDVINQFSNADSVMLSVGSGLGVSVLPVSLQSRFGRDNVTIEPIDDESYTIDCIAAWKSELLNPAAALFLDVVKSKSKNIKAED